MYQSLNFTFNGVSSEDMGVVIINEDGGLYKDIFLPQRSIREKKINGKDRPYFMGVENNPLSFPLSFFIEQWKDRNNLRAITRWMFTDYYKPLIFESNPDRIFYAIIEGNSTLLHNGCQDGHVTLNIRCDSPYSYSPLIRHDVFVREEFEMRFYNEGDAIVRPQLKITKIGDGDISIINQENNQEFKLTGLYNNEFILINCENEEIVSNLQKSHNRYLYNNHNDIWLDFDRNSSSIFTFKGNFDCEFYLEYKYLNEDRPIYY